ncbi:hypothetical protein [Streptomyces xanthochromogenes]|uniref:hypothetical protein n=1 Tax=Streptomyces xanthochromogenes TaxID=67384 RepID=UPI00342D2BCC
MEQRAEGGGALYANGVPGHGDGDGDGLVMMAGIRGVGMTLIVALVGLQVGIARTSAAVRRR